MQLNNGEIFGAREPLVKLLGEKFPVKVSYGLAKIANKLNEQLKVIDDVRNGLIKTYGEVGEDGKIKTKKDGGNNDILDLSLENETKLNAEFNELMEQEIEVVLDKVQLPEKVASTCDKCSHNMDKMLEIEPSVLMALEKFVDVG
ncbi:hypothetical protein LCGC14_0387730 [marine sediment metagenome]|uniref:Uncharacterized protein n=1 Tax=marine sediment metagenome TaxID=412755 RepID=A0A0F9VML4_9ZZZZ